MNPPRDSVVKEYIRLVKDELVLDVGCGSRELSSRLDHVNYLGIDISSKYIEYANQHYGNFGRFVRTEEHYRKLISEQFDISVGVVRTDINAIPYTLFATVCRPK